MPLLFSTLVVGIARHSDDLKAVGRLALNLHHFEVLTTLALVVGLLAVNIAKPGVGVVLEVSKSGAAELAGKPQHVAGDPGACGPEQFFQERGGE